MSRHRALSILVVFAAFVLIAGVPSKAAAQPMPGFALSGGYRYQDDTTGTGTSFPGGAYVDVDYLRTSRFGFTGKFQGNCESENQPYGKYSWMTYGYMGGGSVRVTEGDEWRVFADLLVGAVTDSNKFTPTSGSSSTTSSTHVAFEPDFSVDRMFGNKWGLRFDTGLRFVNEPSTTAKQFQLGLGVVFHP